jgi:membrane protease YdiL (CAAX protease family)
MTTRTRDSVDIRDVAVFYATAVILAVLVALAARGPDGGGLLGLYMFTPLAGLVAMQLARGGGWGDLVAGLGLRRAGLAGWPFALLAPPLLVGVVTLGVVATGAVQVVPAVERPPLLALPVMFAAGVAIGCVFAFGEEVAWRGWLLPRLLPLATWAAILLSGFLHAAWHLPAILLTPHYHGAGTPWLIVPGFLAVLTLAGVAYGYLRLSTGSLWPVVIMHAAINVSLARAAAITAPSDAAMADYLGGESGLFTILALMALSLAIVRFWGDHRMRPASSAP